jgi:hypothetical protein
MQELVGRLTALDPEASESLKVIAYFDALVEGHASLEVLLRGAAVLSGCAAGFRAGATTMRVDSSGRRMRDSAARAGAPDQAQAADTTWPAHPLPDGGIAWIERSTAAHANDAMVLERLAIGLSISIDQGNPAGLERRALEILLDTDETTDARGAAAHRLRLDGVTEARIAATPAAGSPDNPRSVVIDTAAGRVRARILLPGDDAAETIGRASGRSSSGSAGAEGDGSVGGDARTGIGIASAPADLAASWASALIALRMTSAREPVLRADDLGVVLLAAEAADAGRPTHPDVRAVSAVVAADSRSRTDRGADALDVLDALARAESVRGAATLAGVHHSTMQARAADLADALGFDPRTPAGRVRLSDALRLHRLATTRFD